MTMESDVINEAGTVIQILHRMRYSTFIEKFKFILEKPTSISK